MARSPSDEKRFVAYVRDGDARALEELLRAHADSAYTQARRMLGNAADADDAVQEAFLQLARSARRYDPAIPFRAWLGRLVHIAALRVRRADRRRGRREREAAKRRADAMDDDVDHELVRRAVAELPESYRAPIDLHYFAGLSQGECARALGLSENAVAVRIHRGRERLRQALGGATPIATGVVVAALGGAPTHAAPAATVAHAATVAGWAANGALPATTVELGLIQQGAWLMSQHPLAAGAIVATLVAAALVAPLAHAAEGDRHDAPPAPRAPAPPATVAAEPGQTSWWTGRAGALLPFVDPQATIRFGVDLDALKAAAADSPPTAMLRDPRLAKTVAHVRRMLEIWPERAEGIPPLLRWFDGTHGLALSWRVDGDGRAAAGSWLLVADLGAALPTLRDYLDAREIQPRARQSSAPGGIGPEPYSPVTIGPFAGQGASGQILGYDGERFVAATQANLRRALDQPTPPTPRWSSSPLWLEFELARMVANLPRGVDLAARLAPGWESTRPTLAVGLTPQRDGWRSVTTIAAAVRPHLSAIGPVGAGALASAKLAGIAVAFASGDDLGAAIAAAAPGDVLGGLRPALGTFLTGEIAVCADPGAPLPRLSLVAALRPDADRAELAKLLDPMMRQFGAAKAAGADAAWNVFSPLGQLTVVVADDRVVVTSAPDAKPLLARGPALDQSIAAHADLATLGRAYLPLLYARVPAEPVWLEDQDLPQAIWYLGILRDNLAIEIVQDGGRSIGALIARQPSPFGGSMVDHLRRALDATVGSDGIDASFALFTDWEKGTAITDRHQALLFRLADGWHEASVGTYVGWRSPALTLEQARKRVAGLRQVSGAGLEAMKPIALPELATFDRSWLPDIAAVCDHLPEWRLSARCADDGIVVEERGVPLLALAGLAFPAWAMAANSAVPKAAPEPQAQLTPKGGDF